MRLPQSMSQAWRELSRLRLVILALVWLLALSWVVLRPSTAATTRNPADLVTALPTGFLPSNARSLPASLLLEIGRLVEAGAAPVPTPSVADLPVFHRHGLPLKPYAVMALAAQPLWFLLIYVCFIAWVANLLRLQADPEEASAQKTTTRTLLRVLWVGFLWIAVVDGVRVCGLLISAKFGRLESIEPRHWPQVTFAWLLALLRVWAVLAMCVSATQGGLVLRSARRLAATLRARALPMIAVLLVGGFALRFFDWVVNATELSSWPPDAPLAGLLGLVFIAGRAIVGVWVLASLLIVSGAPLRQAATRAEGGPKKRGASRQRQQGDQR